METKTSRTQVFIVGAGPTGLSLAAQLTRYNIDFVIIEKNEATTPYSKAVVVQARSMEIFQQLGLAKKAIATGKITTAFGIYHKGKQKVALNITGLGEGQSAYPYTLSLEQSKTEKLLADYLTEKGEVIHWSCELQGIEETQYGVNVQYKDAKGEQHQCEASYVVGCDGAHSMVRHLMGQEFEGDTVPKLFYVADVKLSSPVITKDELYGFLIDKGFVLFFPMEGTGHYRVIGILSDKLDTDAKFRFEDIEASIQKNIMTPVNFEEVNWFSTYKVHSRKADSFMKGRCFIAGDAAHIHTPAGGQGMNTGIQDVYNLAWKLAYVLDKKMNPSVLETYNTERTENAKHLLKTTDRIFDIMAGTNPFWNFIRIHVVPLVAGFVIKNRFLNKGLFPILSQIGIAYPNSALTIKSTIGKISAGDRMPYFVLKDGTNSYDYLNDIGFKVLYFGAKSPEPERFNRFRLDIKTIGFNELPQALFGNEKDFYILLRPDNHIGYIGKDVMVCEDWFHNIIDTTFHLLNSKNNANHLHTSINEMKNRNS